MSNRPSVKQAQKRWDVPVPKENWKKWWWAYSAHFATGAIAGAGLAYGGDVAPYFVIIPALVVCRQTVEFLRRNDTPGRDLAHHMTGFIIALCVVAATTQLGLF